MSDFIQGKGKNEATLIIEGREIIFDTLTFQESFNHGADGFVAVIPWKPGLDPKLDKIIAPNSFSKCEVYFGGELKSEDILFDITHDTTERGTTKKLEGWSKTANIIDSCILPPYEMNNVTLSERCKQQCEPFGINVIIGPDAANKINETRRQVIQTGYKWTPTNKKDKNYTGLEFNNKQIEYVPTYKSKYITTEKKFPRVCAKQTDKIFDHLADLAKQRGVILSRTKRGDLLITTAQTDLEPVGTISENLSPLTSQYTAEFKGRNRFATYKALVKSTHSTKTSYINTAKDESVKYPRLLVFNASDDVPGNAKSVAEWRKNKTAAESMNISFPVNSWYAPNGKLWSTNTLVTVESITLDVPNGFTFLITDVEFTSANNNSSAVLKLVPPSFYSQGALKDPWN